MSSFITLNHIFNGYNNGLGASCHMNTQRERTESRGCLPPPVQNKGGKGGNHGRARVSSTLAADNEWQKWNVAEKASPRVATTRQ